MLLDDAAERRLPLMIVGITSRPDVLDRALLRPGRLEIVVECPIPDVDARRDILLHTVSRRHTQNRSRNEDRFSGHKREVGGTSIDFVAQSTHGMVGADLVSLCREATLKNLYRCVKHQQVLSPKEGSVESPQTSQLSMDDWKEALNIVRPSGLRAVLHDTRVPPNTPCIGELVGMGRFQRKLRSNAGTACKPIATGHSGCLHHLDYFAWRFREWKDYAGAVSGTRRKRVWSCHHWWRCTELVSKVVGESERAIADLFHRARKMSPCLVFLDQIEAVTIAPRCK